MAATPGELLPEAACRFGDRAAVIVENQVFTFNQLDELSNRIANGLVASGVKAGDRVTLYGHNCWEWLVAYYGIVKTGAVINPINVMLTAEEVRYAVENSGARAVVASQDKGGPLLDIKGGTNLSNVVLWGDTAQRALPRSRIGCAMANQDLI
jgi:long-chain acyl-CoA synthetase